MTLTQIIGLILTPALGITAIFYALWAIGQAEERQWRIADMRLFFVFLFVFLIVASIFGLILIFS